jgi:hypothetical protein
MRYTPDKIRELAFKGGDFVHTVVNEETLGNETNTVAEQEFNNIDIDLIDGGQLPSFILLFEFKIGSLRGGLEEHKLPPEAAKETAEFLRKNAKYFPNNLKKGESVNQLRARYIVLGMFLEILSQRNSGMLFYQFLNEEVNHDLKNSDYELAEAIAYLYSIVTDSKGFNDKTNSLLNSRNMGFEHDEFSLFQTYYGKYSLEAIISFKKLRGFRYFEGMVGAREGTEPVRVEKPSAEELLTGFFRLKTDSNINQQLRMLLEEDPVQIYYILEQLRSLRKITPNSFESTPLDLKTKLLILLGESFMIEDNLMLLGEEIDTIAIKKGPEASEIGQRKQNQEVILKAIQDFNETVFLDKLGNEIQLIENVSGVKRDVNKWYLRKIIENLRLDQLAKDIPLSENIKFLLVKLNKYFNFDVPNEDMEKYLKKSKARNIVINGVELKYENIAEFIAFGFLYIISSRENPRRLVKQYKDDFPNVELSVTPQPKNASLCRAYWNGLRQLGY